MLLTDSVYLMVFFSGLLGGFGHCIGMCGLVVVTYSQGMQVRGIVPHLLYNLGRITTYSLLGGIMGLTGSFVSVIESLERYQNLALALVGAAMVLMGLATGGWLPFLRRLDNVSRLSEGLASVAKFVSGIRTMGSYFPMGLVLGFLPCGLLYTALIAAAGAGADSGNQAKGFLRGMLMLFLFGLGTFPALLLVGQIVSLKGEWLRNKLYRGSAIVMVVIGVIFIFRALRH
ncbi:MAG TPA: sulfite exporter TauE/SafE family protein [Nitrospiraceae bacterium]|jgi:sulfite exporter TauE/SafE|nr:sulfite exporter TauE/SafE family protein [Nitrospiraceae bacterium]